MYCILPSRGFIRVSGDDAVPFLQGIVSSDVTRLEKEKIQYGALLSPQGKFLHDFFLTAKDGAIVIDCEKDRLPDLLARLKMYRLRSKITLDEIPGAVAAMWDSEGFDILPDPRLPELGYRMIGDQVTIESFCAAKKIPQSDFAAYDKMRIELGVPDGSRDMIVDKSLLLEWGIDALHGVDFSKGCYVGQEVTARSKFRANIKKSLYKVASDGAALPAPGTEISDGKTVIGELRSSIGNIGIAILRKEEVENAADKLRIENLHLVASLPAWIKKY